MKLPSFLKKMRYQDRLALIIVVFTMIPLSICGYLFFLNSQKAWSEGVLSEYSKNTSTTGQILGKSMSDSLSKTHYIKSDLKIQSFLLKNGNSTIVDTLNFIEYFEGMIKAVNSDNRNISIRLYILDSDIALGNYCYSKEQYLQDFNSEEHSIGNQILNINDDSSIWVIRNIANDKKEQDDKYLCLYRTIQEYSYNTGILELRIPVSYIIKGMNATPPEGGFMAFVSEFEGSTQIIAAANHVESDKLEQLIEDYKTERKVSGYHILSEKVPDIKEGKVVYFIPNSFVNNSLRINIINFFTLVAVILILLLFAIEFAAFQFTKKINRMIERMCLEIDDFIGGTKQKSQDKEDDFGQIESRVETLLEKTKESYQKIQDYESEKASLELELLQMRFNPHFLYNTLGTIRVIIKDPKVRQVIDSMITYYRIVLNKGITIIEIGQELALIKQYIKLQCFSYDLDFDLDVKIEPEVEKYTIIKHILQPIVENALFHGVRTAKGRGKLEIYAEFRNNEIVFEISDNGMGVDKEKIEKLLLGPSGEEIGGYGIYNVQKRIKKYYGDDYGITYDSEFNIGTTVMMRIPIKIESELTNII